MRRAALCVVASLSVACAGGETGNSPAGSAGEASSASAPAPKPVAPTVREVTVPTGTVLRLKLSTALASDSNQREDSVRAELGTAVRVDGTEALPAGTEVAGTVTDVERSGRVKGRARLAVRFQSLRHDGERYTFEAAPVVREADATKGEDLKKVGIGAGVGAALGGILGGGSGAAKGAAIGGAAGGGAVLATRGDEVRLGVGTTVNARLTKPLVIRVTVAP